MARVHRGLGNTTVGAVEIGARADFFGNAAAMAEDALLMETFISADCVRCFSTDRNYKYLFQF